ncbi:MAG: APC family permease [Clostridia bacterium]
MEKKRNLLSKVLGRTDIIAIGFGTMVGWSWVMMGPIWVNEAGLVGAIAAFIIGGAIILTIGLTYGELTAALPLAGGEFVFAYRAMGNRAAWIVGWIMSMAYIGVAAWEGIALATAMNYMFPLPQVGLLWEVAGYQVHMSWALVGMLGAVIITLLNFFGVRPAVLFQVMATAAMMIIVLFIFFGGAVFGSVDNIGDMFGSYEGFSYVFLMVPAMLIGFDVIPQSSEEMNIEPRYIGKMILVCIIVSIIWYILLITGVSLAAPVEIRGSGVIPMADVASYMFNGDIFSVIIIVGGIFGILTSWNGFFIGATRLLFSMGRAGMLPAVFGRLHKKYRTPYVAIFLIGAVCVTAPLLGMNALVWFMDTSTFCALISYILVIISFIMLKKNEPELPRPFNIKGGAKTGIFILAITAVYLGLYINANVNLSGVSPEFVITAAWMLIGFVMVKMLNKRRKPVSREERELLIFGEKFARKGVRNEK